MWNDVLALNRLTASLVVLVLALVAWSALRWLAAQPAFAIRTVVVTADGGQALEHVTAARVAQACVPRITGTLFTADLGAVRSAFEALPWVRRASVRREWPNRLVVRLEEHRALARWNDDAGNRFVSLRGESFNAPGEAALGATLPLLTGPEGSEADVARHYEAFRQRLALIGKLPQVVTLSPRQAWTLRLADGLVVEVGREQPALGVMARVERFVSQYRTTVGQLASRVDVVDLRYPNGFAVRVPGFRAAVATPRPASAAPKRKPGPPARGAKPARGRA